MHLYRVKILCKSILDAFYVFMLDAIATCQPWIFHLHFVPHPSLYLSLPLDLFNVFTRQIKKSKLDKNQFSISPEVSEQAETVTTNPTTASTIDRTSTSRKPNQTVSPCVLAIVNCCSRYDDIIRTPCFEKYHCSGAFFGRNPCSTEIKSAAFLELEKYT